MWKNTRIGDWVTFTGDAAKQFGKFKSTTAGLVSNIDESLVPPLTPICNIFSDPINNLFFCTFVYDTQLTNYVLFNSTVKPYVNIF